MINLRSISNKTHIPLSRLEDLYKDAMEVAISIYGNTNNEDYIND